MDEFVRDFYVRTYPDDDLGYELDPDATFQDIWDSFEDPEGGARLYDLIGVGDSLVRERLFEHLSDCLDCDYDVVYEAWLNGRYN